MLIKKLNGNNNIIDHSTPDISKQFFDYSLVIIDNVQNILIGGVDVSTNESIDEIDSYDISAKTLTSLGNMTQSRAEHISLYKQSTNEIYTFGGKNITDSGLTKQYLDSVEKYNITSEISSALSLATIPVNMGKAGIMGCSLDEGRFFLTGGAFTDNSASQSIYIFNTVTNSWVESQLTLPNPLAYGRAVNRNGEIYIIGGINLNTGEISNKIYKYTPSNI